MVLWLLLIHAVCGVEEDTVSIVTCHLPVIDNGQVIDNGNENIKVGHELSVKCGSGYIISRETKSVCQHDGTYKPAVPKCLAQNCPAPTIPRGKVSPSSIVPSGKGKITCDKGFSLNNDVELTCITLNIFTPSTFPACVAGFCKKVAVKNGVITGPTPFISPGSKLMIQCKEGYVKQDKIVITCVTDDQYTPSNANGVDIICQAQNCPAVNIKNGASTPTTISPGGVMVITCHPNYRISSNTSIKCISTTLFNPSQLPTCSAQECPTRTIDNGVSPAVQPGQQYAVKCNKNYKLSDLTIFTCISLDSYSPSEVALPTCKAKDCTRPTIQNGEVSGPHIISPDGTVNVKCGSEYRINGESVLKCEAGDKFNKDIPTCEAVSCPAPKIVNATVDGSVIAPNGTVKITCNEPYDLNHNNKIVCISNNTFEPSVLPQCVRVNCIKRNIINGQVTGPKVITPDSVLLIQCSASYKISHHRPVKCNSKNDYNDTIPTCNDQWCPKPSEEYVLNGVISGPNSSDPDAAIKPGKWFSVSCNINYQLVGEARLVCKSGSLFESAYPTCNAIPCPKPTIPHGYVSNNGNEIAVGVKVVIGCDSLYQLNSSVTVLCVAGDVFTPYLPLCKGYPCKPSDGLPNIPNGHYTYNETAVGHELEVKCSAGYDHVAGTAVCVTKSNYDGVLPSCKPENCTVPQITNGWIKKAHNIGPGDLIEVKCYGGFKISSPHTVRCITRNVYNPTDLPTCTEVPCPPPTITNGKVTTTSSLNPGDILFFTCNKHYQRSTANDVRCVSGNNFTESLPTCDATSCHPKPSIVNGLVTNVNIIKPGNSVIVRCDADYKLSHLDDIICVTNRTYKPDLPTCNNKDCGMPEIANGSVVIIPSVSLIREGTKLTLSCDLGYKVEGSATFVCVRADTFNPPKPSCKAQPCQVPSIQNGTLTPSTGTVNPTEKVAVRCHSKYTLTPASSTSLSCVAGDAFQPVLPRCIAKECKATIAHGSVESTALTPGEQLRFTCDTGYYTSTSTPIKCVADNIFTDGTIWSNSIIPTCDPRNCNPPTIKHGSVTNNDTIQPNDVLSITCNDGYVLSSSADVTCVTESTFSSAIPTCDAQNCQVPTIVDGAVTSALPLKPEKPIDIGCNAGYTRSNTDKVFCVTDTIYRPTALPTCIKNCIKPPDLIPNGNITGPTTLTPGDVLQIRCSPGFELVNKWEVVKCVTDNQFNPPKPSGCEAVHCPVPRVNKAIVHDTSPLSPGDRLRFSCWGAYQKSSDVLIKCVSGNVFTPSPLVQCIEKDCPVPMLEHGTIHDNSPLSTGDKLSYTCNTGYRDRFNNHVYCNTSIHYDPGNPECLAQNCVTPKISGAYITPSILSPGTVITVHCAGGKKSEHEVRDEVYKCITDQLFTLKYVPSCVVVSCPTHSISIPHSKTINNNNSTLKPEGVLSVICDENYLLSSRVVKCVSSTIFNDTLPSCEARDCEKPIIANGIVTTEDKISPGSTLVLRCGEGYIDPAITHFRCLSYKLYSVTLPKCRATDHCTVPPIQNGSAIDPAPGEKLNITCDKGYGLDCKTEFFCITATMFYPNSELPKCKPLNCVNNSVITQGDITGPTPVTPGSRLTIQCKAGYAFNQYFMPKCICDDVFVPPLDSVACVKAINCKNLDDQVHNGQISHTVLAPGNIAQLNCSEGFSPRPQNGEVFCVVDKKVYPQDYGCYRTSCLAPSVSHGIVNTSTLNVGDTIRLLCSKGYYDQYNGNLKCEMSGAISQNGISCKECNRNITEPFGTITSPMFDDNANYPDNTRCTYTITTSVRDKVKLVLTYLDIEQTTNCRKDYLRIYDGDSTTSPILLTTCGRNQRRRRATTEIESTGHVMLIEFVSDGTGSGRGFSATFDALKPAGLSTTVKIVIGVVVPLLILILVIVLFLCFLYYRKRKQQLTYSPHKNFHWNEGGPIDNAFFHHLANGGVKAPVSIAQKMESTFPPAHEDDSESMASTCSRTHLTNRSRPFSNQSQTPSYSTVKMNQSSYVEPQVSFRPPSRSPRSNPSNHDTSLDRLEKYSQKKVLEDLGLSEKDFQLNLPGSRMNKLSSEDESGPRTALEDTLTDGDPLGYTNLSNEVLRSPETMRALAKFRAGARKHGPSKHEDPHTEEYELKQQNRAQSEHKLEDVRNAYKAGYRRALPPNIASHINHL